MPTDADVIIVGAGLAGLAAAAELADAGRRVIIVDQEPEGSLGGQAFWSFGGLFLIDSPEQRRMGIRDSYDLAHQDWMGTAARDRQIDNPFSKDTQITHIRGARNYRGDRLIRTAPPHKLLDPAAGPLIAVRLHILTRKTLGGLQTDLSARVLNSDGQPIQGLYAAGEVAGFGGGGMHGYAALEGTFLGGCIFSGRARRGAGGGVIICHCKTPKTALSLLACNAKAKKIAVNRNRLNGEAKSQNAALLTAGCRGKQGEQLISYLNCGSFTICCKMLEIRKNAAACLKGVLYPFYMFFGCFAILLP